MDAAVPLDAADGRRVLALALVIVSAIIPWAVYTRYVLNSAASWPEPLAVLLTIGITFIGAAELLSPAHPHEHDRRHRSAAAALAARHPPFISELLMGVVALFMLVWGMKLVLATWGNSVDEFPWLSVGVTYLPIAVSGAMMLLFVVERLTIGPPASTGGDAHLPVE